jgi:hypothetical protein
MYQQFNGNIGQVAGNDINNHYAIYIRLASRRVADNRDEHRQLIHDLLRKCDLAGIRKTIERIALGLYGSSYFKSLSHQQLLKLHAITDEIMEVLYASRGYYAAPVRSVDILETIL